MIRVDGLRNSFEEQYRNIGIGSQRLYPNEALIGFLASERLLAHQEGEGKGD